MLFTFQNLLRAHTRCLKGKEGSTGALLFDAQRERNLFRLLEELRSGAWAPSPSFCFVTGRPKAREIFAAAYRDRVVHHLVVGALEPYWERRFIADSYACRKGKGTHAGVARLQQLMRSVTANRTRRAWYLHLDVRSYFPSIDRRRLLAFLLDGLRREAPPWHDDLAWLLGRLLEPSAAEGAVRPSGTAGEDGPEGPRPAGGLRQLVPGALPARLVEAPPDRPVEEPPARAVAPSGEPRRARSQRPAHQTSGLPSRAAPVVSTRVARAPPGREGRGVPGAVRCRGGRRSP